MPDCRFFLSVSEVSSRSEGQDKETRSEMRTLFLPCSFFAVPDLDHVMIDASPVYGPSRSCCLFFLFSFPPMSPIGPRLQRAFFISSSQFFLYCLLACLGCDTTSQPTHPSPVQSSPVQPIHSIGSCTLPNIIQHTLASTIRNTESSCFFALSPLFNSILANLIINQG